jgi:signal transduction histidine kinase/PAS domain-containing protein
VELRNELLVALAKDPALHAGDFDSAVRTILEADARALEVERVSLWCFEQGGTVIRSVDELEASARRHSSGQVLRATDAPAYFTALESARTLDADDARQDPRTREYVDSYLAPHGISSMLDVPVRVGGATAGILCHEHVGDRRAWTRDECAFAASMADFVALAMESRMLKQAEAELRATTALLTATLEASADGVLVVDLDDRLTLHNHRFMELFRMREDCLLHQDGGAMAAVLSKLKDQDRYARRLRALRTQPVAVDFDLLELACGRVLECCSHPQRLNAAVVGRVFWFRDVTSRVLVDAELDALVTKERKARCAADFLVEATRLLAASLDYELNLLRASRMCVRSFADWCYVCVVEDHGLRPVAAAHRDRAKELRLTHALRAGAVGPLDPAWQVSRTGRPFLLPEVALSVLRSVRDDRYAQLAVEFGLRSVLVVPAASRGQTVATLSFCSSAPGRAFGDDDLALAEDLARRVATAVDVGRLHHKTEEAARMRSEFLAVASHELRTPVASLQLALQAMRRASPANEAATTPQLRRLLEIPERQAERLARLVDGLLDVSRIETGRLRITPESLDLLALAREIAARSEHDAARAGSALLVHGAPVTGHWDRSLLDQVITNILSNALRYGAGKPIELVVSEREGSAVLEISDHGIGIAPARLPCIFERFERAASADHYPGLGLGLFISRAIVDAHGGQLVCRSEPGQGSTFTVMLPRDAPKGQPEVRA